MFPTGYRCHNVSKTFDTYCIDAPDLDAARQSIERVLPIKFVEHESMFWGGIYYLANSDKFGEIAVRYNYNSYTCELNEPSHPECKIIVSVSEPPHPEAVESLLAKAELRLVARTVV